MNPARSERTQVSSGSNSEPFIFPTTNPLLRAPPHAVCTYQGIRYASCSEAICAALLERFVPGFVARYGETFQVPIGDRNGKPSSYADFCIDGVFFEYHPPRMRRSKFHFGDFASAHDYYVFQRRLDACRNGRDRSLVFEQTSAKLSREYTGRRQMLLDQEPSTRGAEVVVARNPGEFYELVLCRFSPNPPSRAVFEALYETLKVRILRDNPAYRAMNRRGSAQFPRWECAARYRRAA